jgi:periodic tryptophan protein 1
VAFALDADSEDDDAEDDAILPTDSLVIVAITEDEYSHLEIQLLSEDYNLYTHHDITLPEFPICLSWLDCPPFQTDGGQLSVGNYCAVGTFDPAIEIWNLDVMDPLEPTAVLGGKLAESAESKSSRKKNKGGKGKLKKFKPGSHTDAVMALGWNSTYRQALASGSADKNVKIWDVTTQLCSHTFDHHRDKASNTSRLYSHV